MANHAALTYCLVLVDKWAALLCVTLEAGFVSGQESEAASRKLLLNVCRSALGSDPFVRFMAIAAAHFAFKHRMVMRQLKRCPNVQVTLKTGVRRFSRIDDRTTAATGLNVQAPRPMARLATHVLCVFPFGLEASVSGCPEIAHDLLVTGCAFL